MKKIKYILTVIFSFIPVLSVGAIKKVTCGNLGGVASKIPQITSYLVFMLQVAVPIILVIIGMVDLIKGITVQKEDEIKKTQQIFLKRLIAAAIVFFAIVIVKAIISLVAGQNSDNIIDCMDCFLSNHCTSYIDISTNVDNVGSSTKPNSGQAEVTFDSDSVVWQINSVISSTARAITTATQKIINALTGAQTQYNIFIGDSRIVQICQTVTGNLDGCEYSTSGKENGNDYFIASGGQGYSWFSETAIGAINTKLKNSTAKQNIIILMGVNDSGYDNAADIAQKYFNDISNLAKNEWKDQNIVYVSVLPVVETSQHYAKEKNVKAFNNKMSSLIASSSLTNLEYCDIYQGLSLVMGRDTTDGLHFTAKLNKEIYNAVLNVCFK